MANDIEKSIAGTPGEVFFSTHKTVYSSYFPLETVTRRSFCKSTDHSTAFLLICPINELQSLLGFRVLSIVFSIIILCSFSGHVSACLDTFHRVSLERNPSMIVSHQFSPSTFHSLFLSIRLILYLCSSLNFVYDPCFTPL